MSHTEQPLEMVATTEQSSVVEATSKESLIVGWAVGVQSETGAIFTFPFQNVFATEAEAQAEAAARRERKPYVRYVAVPTATAPEQSE